MPHVVPPRNVCPEVENAWPHHVSLFGLRLAAVSMTEAVALLSRWTRASARQCRYVVTPNVDHVVLFQQHAGLRAAYADAALVVADGWPVVAAARWLGQPLPERVAGSDLVPRLFDAADPGMPLRTYLLGAAPGVAARAVERIHARWPAVQVVGYESPPLGFENCPEENELLLQQIDAARPDLLIIGLGAPKQELWVHAHRGSLPVKVAVCAGATIDFLAGEKKRAPPWTRRIGLEWLHRMLSEPRRLTRRYCRDAWIFPQLVYRERRRQLRAQALASLATLSEPVAHSPNNEP